MKHLDISSIKGESYSSKTFWLLIIKESTDNCWSFSWHESKAEKRVLDLINELIKRTSTTLVRLMAVSGKIVSIDSIKSNSHLCFNSSSVAAAPEATHSAHPIVAQRRLNRVDYLIAQHRTIQSIRRKRDRYRYTEPSITNMIESWFASPTNPHWYISDQKVANIVTYDGEYKSVWLIVVMSCDGGFELFVGAVGSEGQSSGMGSNI